jgi:hypothetical protein
MASQAGWTPVTSTLLILVIAAALGMMRPNPRASTFIPLLLAVIAGVTVGYLTLPN